VHNCCGGLYCLPREALASRITLLRESNERIKVRRHERVVAPCFGEMRYFLWKAWDEVVRDVRCELSDASAVAKSPFGPLTNRRRQATQKAMRLGRRQRLFTERNIIARSSHEAFTCKSALRKSNLGYHHTPPQKPMSIHPRRAVSPPWSS